jgi:nucleoside-diphosphate-sugar epimerase
MKVLVTGAGGFLGGHVVDRLSARGHGVRAICRPASAVPEWKGPVDIFRADLRADDDLAPAFDGIDAVLHLAAATTGGEDAQFASSVVGTEKLLSAMAKSSVRRLAHVSSLVVYDWSRADGVMDEHTALLADPYGMGGYTVAKVWQERLVSKCAEARSWDLTIVRPGFIWGPQHAEIAGMGRHWGRLYIMFGPTARLPLCHVVNCAHFLVETLESPAAIGQTFNLVDGDDIRVWRYVREYTRRTGIQALLLPVPYLLGYGIAQLASITSRILFGDKGKLPSLLTPHRYESQFKPIRFSARKSREIMGWKPPLDFEQCLSQTYT